MPQGSHKNFVETIIVTDIIWVRGFSRQLKWFIKRDSFHVTCVSLSFTDMKKLHLNGVNFWAYENLEGITSKISLVIVNNVKTTFVFSFFPF